MKNKVIKAVLSIAILSSMFSLTVCAGQRDFTTGLSVGGAMAIDGGIVCTDTQDDVDLSYGTKDVTPGVKESTDTVATTANTTTLVTDALANTPAGADEQAGATYSDAMSLTSGDNSVSDDSTPEEATSYEEILLSVGATADEGIVTDEDENDDDEGGSAYGYTNLGIARVEDHLNVRATADDNSKIIGKMSNDSGCEVLEVVGDKAHIVSGSVEGYVSTEYILMGSEAVEYAKTIVKPMANVNADGLKVRCAPNLDAEVITMVPYGEDLEVSEELDGWVRVFYDGKLAYVSADYVTVGENLKTALNMTEFLYGEGVSDVRVELCEYAKQFIGNPYVWGGTSLTNGADCSGFTMSVMAKYGIYLPHSSRAQANMGTAVTMAEAKPGDLVFYSKGKTINHVAIYIGGGQVVHASSPKYGIRITSVYYRTPTKIRRFIQD